MESKVSVIVPVYNVEKYLPKCLESIIQQTLKEISFILVDDGSTDNSGKICEEYKGKDDRIQVIHQENKGLSAARNCGIRSAKTPFIMFVDGDDWVDPHFCEIPYQYAIKYNTDIVIFNYWRVRNSGEKAIGKEGLVNDILTRQSAMQLLSVIKSYSAWNKLYRKELFDNITYPKGFVYEDIGTTYKLINASKSVYALNLCLYYYCERKGSITATESINNINNRYEMMEQMLKDLSDWGDITDSQALAENAGNAIHYLIRAGRRRKCSSRCITILKSRNIPADALTIKRKILRILLLYTPVLFDWACIITGKRLRK